MGTQCCTPLGPPALRTAIFNIARRFQYPATRWGAVETASLGSTHVKPCLLSSVLWLWVVFLVCGAEVCSLFAQLLSRFVGASWYIHKFLKTPMVDKLVRFLDATSDEWEQSYTDAGHAGQKVHLWCRSFAVFPLLVVCCCCELIQIYSKMRTSQTRILRLRPMHPILTRYFFPYYS